MSEELSAAHTIIRHHIEGDGGLLDSLRPYRGRVDPELLAEALRAVRVVSTAAAAGEPVAAALVSAFLLIGAVHGWALRPDSMLMRNRLLTPEDADELSAWVVDMEDAFASILGLLADREKDVR